MICNNTRLPTVLPLGHHLYRNLLRFGKIFLHKYVREREHMANEIDQLYSRSLNNEGSKLTCIGYARNKSQLESYGQA